MPYVKHKLAKRGKGWAGNVLELKLGDVFTSIIARADVEDMYVMGRVQLVLEDDGDVFSVMADGHISYSLEVIFWFHGQCYGVMIWVSLTSVSLLSIIHGLD